MDWGEEARSGQGNRWKAAQYDMYTILMCPTLHEHGVCRHSVGHKGGLRLHNETAAGVESVG